MACIQALQFLLARGCLVPVVVSLYHPRAGIVTAAVVAGALLSLDRAQGAG